MRNSGFTSRTTRYWFAWVKIVEINRELGLTILLVEQNANLALEVSQMGYVLETGRIILSDTSAALRENPQVRACYLGGGET